MVFIIVGLAVMLAKEVEQFQGLFPVADAKRR
jgi:hypothetical protein